MEPVKAAPVAPKTPEDYQKAAIEGLAAQNAAPPPEKPADQQEKEPESEGQEAPEGEKPADQQEKPVEKPAEKDPKPPEEVPDRIKQSFEVLAREKAQLRAEKAALAADREKIAAAERLLNAKDPVSLLAAAGFSHKQYTDQLLEGKFAPEKESKPAEETDVVKEVRELKAELKRRDQQAAKARIASEIKARAAAGGEKFKFTRTLGAEGEAQAYLENYFSQTGELPVPGDMAASYDVALEAVEKHYRARGEKWKPLLTGNTPVNKTVHEAPKSDSPQAASDEEAEQQHRTLTNSQSAAPRGAAPTKTVPKTAEDYQKAALAALEKSLG